VVLNSLAQGTLDGILNLRDLTIADVIRLSWYFDWTRGLADNACGRLGSGNRLLVFVSLDLPSYVGGWESGNYCRI